MSVFEKDIGLWRACNYEVHTQMLTQVFVSDICVGYDLAGSCLLLSKSYWMNVQYNKNTRNKQIKPTKKVLFNLSSHRKDWIKPEDGVFSFIYSFLLLGWRDTTSKYSTQTYYFSQAINSTSARHTQGMFQHYLWFSCWKRYQIPKMKVQEKKVFHYHKRGCTIQQAKHTLFCLLFLKLCPRSSGKHGAQHGSSCHPTAPSTQRSSQHWSLTQVWSKTNSLSWAKWMLVRWITGKSVKALKTKTTMMKKRQSLFFGGCQPGFRWSLAFSHIYI